MESRLNSEGFIQQYLIAGLREEAFIDHTKDTNQLRYEKYLRSIITRKQDQCQEMVWWNWEKPVRWDCPGGIIIIMKTGLWI